MIKLLTFCIQFPSLDLDKYTGIHPRGPDPASTNFLAPRLYNLCNHFKALFRKEETMINQLSHIVLVLYCADRGGSGHMYKVANRT